MAAADAAGVGRDVGRRRRHRGREKGIKRKRGVRACVRAGLLVRAYGVYVMHMGMAWPRTSLGLIRPVCACVLLGPI